MRNEIKINTAKEIYYFSNNNDRITTNNNSKKNSYVKSAEDYNYDEVVQFDDEDKTTNIEKCGAEVPGSRWIGRFIDRIDGESKDGAVGNTKQHSTGDCWLLSGINALSYTEKGREIIKNALDYQDGFTIVHLKGYGSVIVTDEEVANTKGDFQYSTGDDDMIIFELAVEKVLDEIAKGECLMDPEAPWYMENAREVDVTKVGSSSTVGGFINELFNLITGKDGEYISDKEKMREALSEFKMNGNKDIALGACVNEDTKAKDINGKTINLAGPHAYSIKKVGNGVVTVINPWDSSDEIQFDVNTFIEKFSYLDKIDLSDNNPQNNHISRTYNIDKDGNKVFIFEDSNKKVRENRDQNGNVVSTDILSMDNKIKSKYTYDPETGKMTSIITYDENGNIKEKTTYDPETGKKVPS